VIQQLAYCAKILDVAAAVDAVDKVTKETITIGVVQGSIHER